MSILLTMWCSICGISGFGTLLWGIFDYGNGIAQQDRTIRDKAMIKIVCGTLLVLCFIIFIVEDGFLINL